MAVTLATYDLIQPTGELTEELFPGGDFDTWLAGWLGQAEAKVEADTTIATADQNTAAAAWVYYRAYAHKVLLMMADPSDIKIGDRSEGFTDAQRQAFVALRDAKLAEYNAYPSPATAVMPAYFGRVRAMRTTTC
jgi:hypothetical protein